MPWICLILSLWSFHDILSLFLCYKYTDGDKNHCFMIWYILSMNFYDKLFLLSLLTIMNWLKLIHHTKNGYILPSKHKPIPALLNSSVSSSHFLIFTFSEGTIFNQESLSSFLFLHCCNIESSSHFSWEDAYRFTVSLNPLIRNDDDGLLRTNIKWRHYMEWEYMRILHSQLLLLLL